MLAAWMIGVVPRFANEQGIATLRYSLSDYVLPSLVEKYAGAKFLRAAILTSTRFWWQRQTVHIFPHGQRKLIPIGTSRATHKKVFAYFLTKTEPVTILFGIGIDDGGMGNGFVESEQARSAGSNFGSCHPT